MKKSYAKVQIQLILPGAMVQTLGDHRSGSPCSRPYHRTFVEVEKKVGNGVIQMLPRPRMRAIRSDGGAVARGCAE